MPSTIATSPRFKFFDANGNPAAYYLLNTYAAGSLTPKTTWKNQDQSTANMNPITLDANGECILWLDEDQEYKFVLTTPLGSVVSVDDNISGGGHGLASRLADSSGSSLVGFIGDGSGAVERTVQDKTREFISVKDFGAVGDGVTDDTAAIQTALDFYGGDFDIPRSIDSEIIFPAGTYRISSITVPRRVNPRFLGSHLTPLDTTIARSHLIKFHGRNKVINLCIDMDYARNYDTVVWCRGRYIDFISPEIWRAKCCFVFGDPAWEGNPAAGVLGDSEITIIGGNTAQCVTHSRLYGQNTIVTFTGGHQAYSYKWSLPEGDPRKAAWEALQEITIINCGAILYLTGAFTGNFSGAQPNFLSKIQVVDDPAYVNTYGKFILAGSHIESGYYLHCDSPGAVPIQDNYTKLLIMNACSGYISGGRVGYLIDMQTAKQGVDIRASNFYGNVGDNIVYCISGNVHVDRDSFQSNTTEFFQKLYSPNLFGYSDYIAANVNTSTQTLGTVPSTIRFTNRLPSSVHSAYAELGYNTTTGIFTALTDMRNVHLDLLLALNGGTRTDNSDTLIYVGGVQWKTFSTTGGSVHISTVIPKLAKGTTVEIKTAQYQSRALYGGTDSGLVISASI